jgi:primase-polymerase (primpol)-like protein
MLKERFGKEKRWINWKLQTRNGKTTKLPYMITGKLASSTNPETWSTYDEAKKADKNVGIVLTADKLLLCVDLDHILEGGKIVKEFLNLKRFVDEADTYTEISQSGSGLHLFFEISEALILEANRHENIECYVSARYIAVTENPFGKEKPIRCITPKEAIAILSTVGYPWGKQEPTSAPLTVSRLAAPLVDGDLLKKIFASKNGPKIEALYNGDLSGAKGDASAADLALCSHLAFWSGRDAKQMENIWLASPLGSREKTQKRQDYRDRTIQAAIKNCKEIYKTQTTKGEKASLEENTVGTKQGGGDEKKNYSELIVELITSNPNIVLFHDDSGEPFVRISTDGHLESWPSKAKSFKRWLAKSFYDAYKKSAPSNSVRDALSTIEGMACYGGKEFPLFNRVALIDGAFWYDLTDDKWRAVKIDAKGWQIVSDPPIVFRRYSHQRPQVEPATVGDVKKLLPFVNISSDQQQLLLLVYIVSCFIPGFPHPIPFVYGSQGSAKSVLSKIIRRLIDPSLTEVLNLPRDGGQFAQLLSHHWYLFFDNVSELLEWQSDMLCKAVTGDGFSKRELYSDDDDIIYTFKRCIGMNGVNLVASKPDLLERSILLELERVPESKRLQESALWERFEAERPIILAGIFTALSKAINIQPMVSVKTLPRMADFAVWGCAIAEAIGYTQQQFLDAYLTNIKGQNEGVLEESLVATAIRKFLDNKIKWEGTPSQLLKELAIMAETLGINTEKEKDWPKAANVFSRRINELKTNLAEDGIQVSRGEKNKERIITLEKRLENTVAIVELSPDGSTPDQLGDDMGNDTAEVLPPL